MCNKLKRWLASDNGHILLESIIAILAVGGITYIIVNTDLLPGLKVKWDAINNALQNKWIH